MHLSGEHLNRDKAAEAWTAAVEKKHCEQKSNKRFQRPTFQTMDVADCRYWTSAMVTENEKKSLIAVEIWGRVVPDIVGAWQVCIAIALRHLMSRDSILMHLIGKQDTPAAADEYPVVCAAYAWAAAVTRDRRRFRGSKRKVCSDKGKKRKVRSDKGKKRQVRAFLSCDDNALEAMFRLGAPPDADSSSSNSQSSSSSSDSSISEDEAEKHCSHCFLGCGNDRCPMLCLVSQRGGTQGCDCIVLWLAGIS